jgi:hypothetical protein
MIVHPFRAVIAVSGILTLNSCTSIADQARQSWQESRQICQKIKEPSERDFCLDMAWKNYHDVLLMSAAGGRAAGSEAAETRDKVETFAPR